MPGIFSGSFNAFKNHYSTGKGGTVLVPIEFESPLHKTDLVSKHDVIVPPPGICPGR